MNYIKLTALNLTLDNGDPAEYPIKVYYQHIGLIRPMEDRTILVIQGQKVLVKETEKEVQDRIKHVQIKDAEWKEKIKEKKEAERHQKKTDTHKKNPYALRD